VILCNEIPDEESDRKAGKKNLIGLVGPERGYMLYGAALLFSFIAVLVNVFYGILPGAAVFSGCFYVIGAGAAYLLKKRRESLEYLNRASMLTIVLHACIGLFMIVILVWK
jgi:1,4-dihydroxy-2-naphthoate octaprenyltransferase